MLAFSGLSERRSESHHPSGASCSLGARNLTGQVANQKNLTPAYQIRFVKHFAPLGLYIHPFHPSLEDYPEVSELKTDANEDRVESWHTDLGFESEPNMVTALRAVAVPEYGRDTLFVDTEAAFNGLSTVMQRMLKETNALRDWRQVFGEGGLYGEYVSEEIKKQSEAELPPVIYPVIAVNEDTGRSCINVDRTFTTKMHDMRPDESDLLLRFLFDQMHIPEYQLRLRWQPDTLVIWDNRTTQHALVIDKSFPRVMHRVMGKGRRLFEPLAEQNKTSALTRR